MGLMRWQPAPPAPLGSEEAIRVIEGIGFRFRESLTDVTLSGALTNAGARPRSPHPPRAGAGRSAEPG
jgi:hypothetical protein